MPQSLKDQIKTANSLWSLKDRHISQLKFLCRDLGLSVESGDVTLIDGGWYVTHAGLLRLADRSHCVGIWARPVKYFCDAENNFWVFKATVFKSAKCKGFDGYGDACPANVSELVRGAEMRVAETRAVNRALRKAYGVSLCSVEEIASAAIGETKSGPVTARPHATKSRISPIKDKLLELIRRHQLDAKLVKTYAENFCGIGDLRVADSEAVIRFVDNLALWAERDCAGLVAHLEQYGKEKEATQ